METAVMVGFAVLLAWGVWELSAMLFRGTRPTGSHG